MLNIAMLSYHTCPLATLGGKDTGGMNVYVRELTRDLGRWASMWMSSPARRMSTCRTSCTTWAMATAWCTSPPGRNTRCPRKSWPATCPQFVEGVKQFAREKGIHYDLIHSHYWMSGIAAEQLQRRAGTSRLCTCSTPWG